MALKIDQLPEITDTQMRERLAATRDYTLLILKRTPATSTDEGAPIIWEHGRRNMALRAAGALAIVCPATGPGELAGIGIFPAPLEEVRGIMEEDPAVQAVGDQPRTPALSQTARAGARRLAGTGMGGPSNYSDARRGG
jgi:hypothetical protein